MSEDNKNENEERDDFFGDDDDFGLPDLDFDALDDDDSDEAPLEEEVPEEVPELPTEPVMQEKEENSEGSMDDIFDSPDATDVYSGSIDISDEGIPNYFGDESESFDDEFKDFKTESEASEEFETSPTSLDAQEDPKRSKGTFARIVVLGFVLFIGLGLGFWYAYNNWFGEGDKTEEADATPKKAPAKKVPPKKQPTQQKPTDNDQSSVNQRKQPTNTPVASTPGTINRLEARTGNTFIIVGSFVDEDFANKLAAKLAAKGKSLSIIPPFGNQKYYYRVAVASYPTIASAQQNLDNFRTEYGQDVWALKY